MIKMTEQEYIDLRENCGGVCTACKERADGVEPDARGYTCDYCGKKKVSGVEELLLCGQIEIVERGQCDLSRVPQPKLDKILGGLTVEAPTSEIKGFSQREETRTEEKARKLRETWKREEGDK